MADYPQQPVVYKKFAGLRNNTPPENYDPSDLQVALNVYIDIDHGTMRRDGQARRNTGQVHSLWSKDEMCLMVTELLSLDLWNTISSYATMPQAPHIVGDIECIAYLAPTEWVSGTNQIFAVAWDTPSLWGPYQFFIGTTGVLAIQTSPDGLSAQLATSTVATGFDGRSGHWVKLNLDVDDGDGNHVYKFYTSDDPPTTPIDSITWTQLGATVTVAGTTVIQELACQLEIGSNNSGTTNLFGGRIGRVQIYKGIGGTLMMDFNANDGSVGATTVTSSATGEVYTIHGTASIVKETPELVRVNAISASRYKTETLRSGLTAGARMSYWAVNGNVYYMNGHETGVVSNGASRSFGLEQPIGQPQARAIGGGLPAGRYQYALTFIRDDGQQSGTGLCGTIDLTGHAGIGFSNIPVSDDPSVVAKAIYITATNGEVAYQAMVIDAADTTANYHNEGYDLRLPLNTQFGQPAPAGHMVAWYRGHMLVARGPFLWYSLPYRYELFMLGRSFLPFEADINLLAPVEDGVFLGADKTYFLSGASPQAFVRTVVAGYPAIPGTLAYEQGDYLGDGVAGRVAYWASTRGHCMGSNGGSFKNLTEARYSYPTAARGAGIVRQTQGINQFIAVLEGSGSANNAWS